MSDRPDYTLPVSIEAITIESLPVDIIAQTIGSIAIDIAAQTLGQVDVNIKASAITLNVDITAQSISSLVVKAMAGSGVSNVGEISNGDFEKYHVVSAINYADDWFDATGAHRRSGTPWSGYSAVTLKVMTPASFNGIYQALSPSIPTNNIASFAIMAKTLAFENATFKVQLMYSDGTSTTQTITCSAWAEYAKTDLTYTASKYIIGIRIYTDDANHTNFDQLLIDALSLIYRDSIQGIIDTIDIDIVAQTIGSIDINVAAQDAAINIDTAGGVNIIIDKLTQTAYVEDQRTLSNHGTSPTPASVIGNNRRGKFFPRGCRGFIKTIDVYCSDAGASGGTVTVYLSPFPGMGYLMTADVTVPSSGAADWRSATFNKMWNYDSLFIFVVGSSSDIKVYYNSNTPFDRYGSDDAGATWTTDNFRFWFRAIMKGQTIGDIPVSGIVNTIPIKAVAGLFERTLYDVDGGATYDMLSIVGSGQLNSMFIGYLELIGTVTEGQMVLRITVDGVSKDFSMNTLGGHVYDVENTPSDITFSKLDNTGHIFQLNWKIPIPFQQSLVVTAVNNAASGNEMRTTGLFFYELTK